MGNGFIEQGFDVENEYGLDHAYATVIEFWKYYFILRAFIIEQRDQIYLLLLQITTMCQLFHISLPKVS